MTDLLNCPFCGGEAVTVHDEWTVLIDGKEEYRHDWYVGCDPRSMLGCMGSLNNIEIGFDTEEQAITAWNTRAERTCHSIDPTDSTMFFICSNCNFGAGRMEFIPNYCPDCGAKVISDSEPVEVWQQASPDDVTCSGE